MAWPATPVLPSNVNPGDRITASYTNVQAQALHDLWTNIQASQTPWQQDINGGGHTLSNVGYLNMRASDGVRVEAIPGIITIVPRAGTGPFNVFNAAATAADWAIDPNGNLTSGTARTIQTGGNVAASSVTMNGFGGTNSLNVNDSAPALAWVVDPNGQLVSYGKRGIHNIGVAIITPVSGANAFIVYNAALSAADWVIDSAGTLFTGTARGVSNVGSVTFADSSVQTTAYKGLAANQTPWVTDINGNSHNLGAVAAINATGTIHTDGKIEGNDIFAAAGLVGGSSGIYVGSQPGPYTQVIAGSGYFCGPGIDMTGPVIFRSGLVTLGNILSRATGIYVQNAAGSVNLGYFDANGAVTTPAVTTNGVDITPTGAGFPLWVRRSDSQVSWYVSDVGLLGSNIGANIATSGNINVGIATANRVAITHTGQLEPFLVSGPGGAEWAIWGSSGDLHGSGKSIFLESGPNGGDIWARNLVSSVGAGFVAQGPAGVQYARFCESGVQLGATGNISFGNANEYYSAVDLRLRRVAPAYMFLEDPSTGLKARLDCGVLNSSSWVEATGFTASGQRGLGDSQTTGAFGIDVTTPSGGKTLWFMGGVLYAVT